MTQTKTGSPFYLLSLSNMLDLIRRTSVHSSSLLYFDSFESRTNPALAVHLATLSRIRSEVKNDLNPFFSRILSFPDMDAAVVVYAELDAGKKLKLASS